MTKEWFHLLSSNFPRTSIPSLSTASLLTGHEITSYFQLQFQNQLFLEFQWQHLLSSSLTFNIQNCGKLEFVSTKCCKPTYWGFFCFVLRDRLLRRSANRSMLPLTTLPANKMAICLSAKAKFLLSWKSGFFYSDYSLTNHSCAVGILIQCFVYIDHTLQLLFT